MSCPGGSHIPERKRAGQATLCQHESSFFVVFQTGLYDEYLTQLCAKRMPPSQAEATKALV